MVFLQPILLWGLAAASLPVLIHLLNRLRYRTVAWAAMPFLLKALRASTRHARLREWLVLAARTLAVACLALLLARPLAGGWVARLTAHAPDEVLILLDRSASMETVDPGVQSSLRERALDLLGSVSPELLRGGRFTALDSALGEPQELADLSSLKEMALASPTDTAADFPDLFRRAADFLVEHPAARPEVWVFSDLQASNWRTDDGRWAAAAARFAGLPVRARVRVVPLQGGEGGNLSLRLVRAVRRSLPGGAVLDLAVLVRRSGNAPVRFPVSLVMNGVRSGFDASVEGGEQLLTRRIELTPETADGGWGRVALPPDATPGDNGVFFAWGGELPRESVVLAEDGASTRRAVFALAPSPGDAMRCDALLTSSVGVVPWDGIALALWQGAVPEGDTAVRMARFVSEGGTLVLLPPSAAATEPSAAEAAPFGFRWGDVEEAPRDAPYRVGAWERLEGPLAVAENGRDLPLGRLAVQRRRAMVALAPAAVAAAEPGAVPPSWATLASYADGAPFLRRMKQGKGAVYALDTLPREGWSELGRDWVLLPMLQRMLEEGVRRFSSAEQAVCGAWTPPDASVSVLPVEGSGSGSDYRIEAGVYEAAGRRVALNRPPAEDEPERADPGRVAGLLGEGVSVEVAAAVGTADATAPSEMWRLLVLLAALFLCAEGALLLGMRSRAPAAAAPAARPEARAA